MTAADHAYFDTRFQALAHRGGDYDGIGENSLRSFARAVELGYGYLETDVHVTSDGVLYAFHDESLERVTDGHGLIAEHTAAELDEVRIDGTDPIPRFAALLAAFPATRFNIDLKAPGVAAPLARLLAEQGAEARVCVSSFSTKRLNEFRRLTAGRVATGLNPLGIAAVVFGPAFLARYVHGQVLQVPRRWWHDRIAIVTPRVLRAAHRAGLRVHVWTINEADEMDELIAMGVDGIVTDNTAVLKRVLRDRGLWEEA